jgi:hypothetical protein
VNNNKRGKQTKKHFFSNFFRFSVNFKSLSAFFSLSSPILKSANHHRYQMQNVCRSSLNDVHQEWLFLAYLFAAERLYSFISILITSQM